jgi:hypothetical protein
MGNAPRLPGGAARDPDVSIIGAQGDGGMFVRALIKARSTRTKNDMAIDQR